MIRRTTWRTVATTVLLFACAPPENKTAVNEQNIANDAQDIYAQYSVRLRGGTGSCSGVLITPRWVLTANHCITGLTAGGFKESDGWGIATSVAVDVIPTGASDSGDAATRTFTTTGSAIVRKNGQMELGPLDGRDDSAQDMALVRLSARVPVAFAHPLHPQLFGEPTCNQSNDFTGRISGFAGETRRYYAVGDDYTRDDGPSTGAVYEKEFILPIPFTGVQDFTMLPIIGTGALVGAAVYEGIEGGDSGGPLVEETGGSIRLCGVASGTYFALRPHIQCGPTPCVTIGQLHAAIDAPEAQDFLRANIVTTDIHGNEVYEGECSAAPGTDVDDDGDGVLDACDNCLDFRSTDVTNTDGDAFGDACDLCPNLPNLVNADTDGDGYGNACDPCPTDAPLGPGDAYGDADLDGICNSVDLCPTVAGVKTKNSNEHFELMYGEEIWGDECEPVPQPATDVLRETTLAWETDSGPLQQKVYSHREERIRVWPRSSKDNSTGESTDVLNVATHYRFCQPGPNGTAPFCDTAEDLDEANLELGLASAANEHPGMPYHRITLGSMGRGDVATYDYRDIHQFEMTWDQDADASFWNTNGIVALPNYDSDNPHTAIDGFIWVHADTNVGAAEHGADLANVLVQIDAVSTTAQTVVAPEDTVWGRYWWLSNWPERGQLSVGVDVMRFFVDSAVGDYLVSPRAQQALRDRSIQWIIPEEVSPHVGAEHPIAVGVGADGHLVQTLGIDEDGHASTTVVRRSSDGALPGRALAAGPAKYVYSRRAGTLFALASNAVYARSVSSPSAPWGRPSGDLGLRTVVDATVSPTDGRIYILDRQGAPMRASSFRTATVGHDELRLLRVDARGREVTTLSRMPLSGVMTRFDLAADRRGDLILSASSDDIGRHAQYTVARLEIGARGLQLGELHRRAGALEQPAHESARGLVGEVSSTHTVRLVRFPERAPRGDWASFEGAF